MAFFDTKWYYKVMNKGNAFVSGFTRYSTRERADEVAREAARLDGDGWTYEVIPSATHFAVLIRDEDGFEVGLLP